MMKRTFLVPFGIAGMGIGLSLVGDALDSQPLKDAGTTAGKFVGPAVNLTAAGYVVKQLRDLSKIKRGGSFHGKEERKKKEKISNLL